MERNKRISVALGLFALGISLLSVGFVQAAELMQENVQAVQVEEVAAQRSSVPSLQTLALEYIRKKTIEGNQHLFRKFKELLEKNKIVFGTCEVVKIAALEYAKPFDKRVSPLKQYKKTNPELGFLIEKKIVEYSLSIQDLMGAEVTIELSQDNMGFEALYFDCLSLTSLFGLQKVENLQSLERLGLSYNQLKELTLPDLPSLRVLYLQNNQLKELTLQGLPSLQVLYLQNNQLKELRLQGLPSLQNLYLQNNQLKELTLSDLPSLKALDLKNNQLTEEVQGALIRLGIQFLDLKDQRMPDMGEIVEELD